MTTTELVWVPKQEIEILYGPHEPTRRERREAKKLRNWKRAMILGPSTAFVLGCTVIAWAGTTSNSTAQADEPTTTTVATTWPTPQTIPPQVAPGWETVTVHGAGWEDLGLLLTDGKHAGYDNRVVPGDVGVAIISVNVDDPGNNAATLVIGGTEWRIFYRGQVDAANLNPLMKRPTIPQVTVLSSKPGAKRTYVEMRQA